MEMSHFLLKVLLVRLVVVVLLLIDVLIEGPLDLAHEPLC